MIKCFILIILTTTVSQCSYDAIISLGYRCQVAHQLYSNGLRTQAYPFDYIITPFESLIALLKNRFTGFCDKQNLMYFQDSKGRKFIIDTRYDVSFIHHFALDQDHFLDKYDIYKEQFDRRIERLYNVLESDNKVLLIRQIISKEQALELTNLFNELFPQLDYTLLAVNFTETDGPDWHLPRVINRVIPHDEPRTWRGNNQAWHALLLELGLLQA